MEINELFDIFLNENLIDIIISNPKIKGENVPAKIKIRPVMLKNNLTYQATRYVGKQVMHENYDEFSVRNAIAMWLSDEYKQGEFLAKEYKAQVLSGKKGNLTIKCKKDSKIVRVQAPLSHNREKKYIIEEGMKVPFMVDLGVMTLDGKIVNSRYDKFRQINRFLEFIEDILPALSKNRKLTILDFGCGKSYLTFAMYYYLKVLKNIDIQIIGLDLKKDVIEHCQKLADGYGYADLKFLTGDIADYDGVEHVDMVVTLHACDTATDYALYKAVKWGADVILSVPCCQHEANYQIANQELEAIFKYGILKERIAALVTDGIRANVLEECGYKTQILEFIDMEHTPKNLLIRAIKDKKEAKENENVKNSQKVEKFLNLNLTLPKLIDSIE